jgi:adenosylmethionine-8-amino-7-oxononanoate aminotransferase
VETKLNETKPWAHFGSPNGGHYSFIKAEGQYLYDESGHKVIDGLSGLMCVQVGYGRKEIIHAMKEQAEELSFCSLFGNDNPTVRKLSSKLLELAPPGFSSVFFTTGGSTAVDTAIKIARQYHSIKGNPHRQNFISRLLSYHGSTYAASMVSGMKLIRDSYGHREAMTKFIPPSNSYRCRHCDSYRKCSAECLEPFMKRLKSNSLAGCLIEPIQNGGGVIPTSVEYNQKIVKTCRENDTLIISDETICSFGRTGSWFGCQTYGYQPDLIVIGKGLTNGYSPMGAVLVSEKIVQAFKQASQNLAHGFTFGGHMISCAAALETINVIEKESILENVRNIIEPEFQKNINRLEAHDWVGNVRGGGAFWAIELTADKESKLPFRGKEDLMILSRLSEELYKLGLYCRTDDREEPTITVAPHLNSTKEDIEKIINIIEESLNTVWREVQGYD